MLLNRDRGPVVPGDRNRIYSAAAAAIEDAGLSVLPQFPGGRALVCGPRFTTPFREKIRKTHEAKEDYFVC
jgi:hypothetical protein